MAVLQQIQDYRIPVYDPAATVANMRGAAIKQRGQQLQNEAGEFKLDQLKQSGMLKKAVFQAQEVLALPRGNTMEETDQIQNQYFQQKVAETQAAGGDVSGLMKIMSLSPEQRLEGATNMIGIGQQQGILEQDPKPVAEKNLIVKRMIVDGEDRYVGFDPISGEQVRDMGAAGKAGGVTVNVGGDKMAGTPGNIAQDKIFAGKNLEWKTTGKASNKKNINRMKNALKAIKQSVKADDLWTSKYARIVGRMPDILKTDKQNAVASQVRGAIMASLRETLGAQFTAEEGERIVKTAFDPTLPGKYNLEKINELLTELKSGRDVKNAMSKYWDKNKTIFGFEMPEAKPPAKEKIFNYNINTGNIE